MCFDLNMAAFFYNDSEYFNWFAEPNEENLEKIIRWKRLNRNNLFDERNNFWNGESIVIDNLNNYSIVTRAFLCHLYDPIEYPILDPCVWKAMRNLEGNGINQNFNEWEGDYLGIYVPFFNNRYKEQDLINCPQVDGVDIEIVRRRMLDRALWEYGRML